MKSKNGSSSDTAMSLWKAYSKMWSFFDPELEELIPVGQDKVAFAIDHLSQPERKAVYEFLSKLLKQDLTDKQLSEVWQDGGSRIGLENMSDYRRAFTRIRDQLNDSLKP